MSQHVEKKSWPKNLERKSHPWNLPRHILSTCWIIFNFFLVGERYKWNVVPLYSQSLISRGREYNMPWHLPPFRGYWPYCTGDALLEFRFTTKSKLISVAIILDGSVTDITMNVDWLVFQQQKNTEKWPEYVGYMTNCTK